MATEIHADDFVDLSEKLQRVSRTASTTPPLPRDDDGEIAPDKVVVDIDVDLETLRSPVLPYCIGFFGKTHGLTDVEFAAKRLTFERVA